MSRMFPFITKTWNPLGGACLHNCSYCWAKKLSNRYNFIKYTGEPYIVQKEMTKSFQENDYVFVCDMVDLFGDWVPSKLIQKLLDYLQRRVNANSFTKFLLLTKNPSRYLEFEIPDNCVCGATIETDLHYPSKAPTTTHRLSSMMTLNHEKMVSIEPIMDFTLYNFADFIIETHPEFVAVGYDNYNNGLVEPSLEKTKTLIALLEQEGIKVYRKTLREPLTFPKEAERKENTT